MTTHAIAHEDLWDEDDETQPSALEYARSVGFCRDYMLDHPFDTCISNLLPLDTEHDWNDPPGASPVVDASFDQQFKERLETPKEAAIMLQEIMFPDENHSPLDDIPDVVPQKSLKVGLPLLLTDHDADMREFCTRTPEVRLNELKLPLEHVDIENDEGMEWPARYKNLPAETMKQINEQRLEIPKDAIKFLESVIVPKDDDVNHDHIYSEIVGYVKSKSNLITPPLTPILSPVAFPFDPSSDTGQVPLLPDSTDSVAGELEAIDNLLQSRDRVRAPNFHSSDEPELINVEDMARIYAPMQSDLASTDVPSPLKRKVSGLAVEVPLLVSDNDSSVSSKRCKSVSFAEQLSILIPNPPPSRPMHELDPASEESMQGFFDEVVVPKALEVEQAAGQEKLQAEDSLQRVQVPIMDFSRPPPPWATGTRTSSAVVKRHNLADAWQELLIGLKAERQNISACGHWKSTAKMERQLQSHPFDAELGRVPPEPPIDDVPYIAVIMSDMSLEDVVTSDNLVWKPEGLRVQERYKHEFENDLVPIQHEDEDEEVEVHDMDELLYKRHQKILQARHEPSALSILPQKRALDDCRGTSFNIDAAHTSSHGGGSLLGGGFTTASNLHSFMNSIGQQSKIVPQGLKVIEEAQQPAPMTPASKRVEDDRIENEHALQVTEDGTGVTVPFELPRLPAERPDRAVIISLDLLQRHRNILKIVFKELYRNAKHIERDFSTVVDAPEADILLSPGTGLILTSLQKLKQKALPGQVQVNSVRERISRLASRYELLVILIGDGLACEDIEVDERDCAAVNEFQAFCAQFTADVQIRLVPSGDESIAAWMAMSMYELGDTGQEMRLLHEETVWEQVLRRTGLNAYAAQGVLASLKDEDVTPISDTALSFNAGIGAFIRMRPEQRIANFAGLVGGHGVLQNVNRVLEQPWISAQTGFR